MKKREHAEHDEARRIRLPGIIIFSNPGDHHLLLNYVKIYNDETPLRGNMKRFYHADAS